MDAYMYQAALYCENCIAEVCIRDRVMSPAARDMPLTKVFDQCIAANGWRTEADWDSDEFPKGPYPDGGGESDSPQHCAECDVFLGNPLTDDGVQYVRSAIDRCVARNWLNCPAITEWAPFYRLSPGDCE